MTDYEGKPLAVGDRIELHPGCDMWMRGAKYGVVEQLDRTGVRVRLDNAPWKLRSYPADRMRVLAAVQTDA